MTDTATLRKQARAWLAEDPDPATRKELEVWLRKKDNKSLSEAFGGRLQFGTAGLRGVLGPGPNRMNRLLVRRVSAGLGQYLLDNHPKAKTAGVVVGGDARRLSPEMAEDTARVLAGMGIPVHLFDGYAPTPVLAFAVRKLKACAGVVVTASHNPPEYNGYKVYWDNAAQIIPPHDTGISDAIDAVGAIDTIAMPELTTLRRKKLVRRLPKDTVDAYYDELLALRRHPDIAKDVEIVYTPMHGVGGAFVQEILKRAGYKKFRKVTEQFKPDGEFPTVRFPNPEEDGAMDLSLEVARKHTASLVLANDPDADRLAVAVPLEMDGDEYRLLSGNEIGSLLAYYLLTEKLPKRQKSLVMTTIVSSRQLSRMAKELGAHYDETLTGFKWIANRSQQFRKEKKWRLVMGYEEALGYTVGEVVADKDGIGAALLFAELAAVCKSRGLTILDYLEQMIRRFGLYVSHQHSVTLPGSDGATKIATIMQNFRADMPKEIDGSKVVETIDYADGHAGLPPSNVLALTLANGARILLRPSGTEPKIKYYFEIDETLADSDTLQAAQDRGSWRLQSLVDSFLNVSEERAR